MPYNNPKDCLKGLSKLTSCPKCGSDFACPECGDDVDSIGLTELIEKVWSDAQSAKVEEIKKKLEGMKTEAFERIGYTGEKVVRENTLDSVLSIIKKEV